MKLKKGKAVAAGYSDGSLRLQRQLRNLGLIQKVSITEPPTHLFINNLPSTYCSLYIWDCQETTKHSYLTMGLHSVSEKQARPNTWSHMLGMHMWQDPELARGGSPGNSKGRMMCSISRVRSVQFCFPSNLCSLNTHRSRQPKLSSGKSQSWVEAFSCCSTASREHAPVHPTGHTRTKLRVQETSWLSPMVSCC